MEQILDLGPELWAIAPNMPKIAQNTKILTAPTVFELGGSSHRMMLSLNSWNRFLIGAQFSGYCPNMPKMGQNTKILTTLKADFYCCAAVALIRSLIALV